MTGVDTVVVVVVAVFAAAMLGAWLRGGAPKSDASGLREEVQRLFTMQSQGFAAQVGQISQVVTQQISEVRRELEQGVTTAGQITSDAQHEVSEQLRNSTDVLSRLSQHLDKVQESGRELTQAAQTMQAVFGGPKSRGVVGEAQLQDLLGDVLPRSSYEFAHTFSNGATATAVLHTGHKLVAIDADFPLQACRKAVENGPKARVEFAQAVRQHVDTVAESLILPAEGTLDVALMFVPSESAFLELLLTSDEQGRLEDYCRQKRVLPVSPNSLHAYLSAVLIGLRGMDFEENAKRMLASLEDVKKQFDQFGRVHAELGNQLRQTSETYEEAGRQLAQARTALDAAAPAETPAETSAEVESSEIAETVPVEISNNGA
jgi:DNA recombination protein RmuC